ncbi:sigma-70 family RNA polymerase sigma factor [bacterium]|nr:sigma-70 family RNA polymerase sigma factor [bacterium]
MQPEQDFESLLPQLYSELHVIARSRLRHDRLAASLRPTELVHETYLRLHGTRHAPTKDRVRVLALASGIMRNLLVDLARRRAAAKRGNHPVRVTLHDNFAGDDEGVDLLALNDALLRLERLDARSAEIVQMRFFAGLTETEIAAHLGISDRWVRKLWVHARSWLRSELA